MENRRFKGLGGACPPPANHGHRDKDEDQLLLFQELRQRDKDQTMSLLLLPVSDEFEATGVAGGAGGHYPISKTASAKKGCNSEFLAETDKNDYDWLKTPPATPLFPSLEMEANAGDYIPQREIPIIQTLSRFAGNQGAKGATNTGRGCPPKSPKTNPKAPPPRSITPNPTKTLAQRITTIPLATDHTKGTRNNTSRSAALFVLNQKMTQELAGKRASEEKPASLRQVGHMGVPALNHNKFVGMDSKDKPFRTRGVSTLARSTVATQFSEETPPNLSKDRPGSTSRIRPNLLSNSKAVVAQPTPEEPSVRPRRQSFSPRVVRGQKVEANPHRNEGSASASSQSDWSPAGTGDGSQVLLGSRMVERVMNARKLSRPRHNTPFT